MLMLNSPMIVQSRPPAGWQLEWRYATHAYPDTMYLTPEDVCRNVMPHPQSVPAAGEQLLWYRVHFPGYGTFRLSGRIVGGNLLGPAGRTSQLCHQIADRLHVRPHEADYGYKSDSPQLKWTRHCARHVMMLEACAILAYHRHRAFFGQCPLWTRVVNEWVWTRGIPVGPCGADYSVQYFKGFENA